MPHIFGNVGHEGEGGGAPGTFQRTTIPGVVFDPKTGQYYRTIEYGGTASGDVGPPVPTLVLMTQAEVEEAYARQQAAERAPSSGGGGGGARGATPEELALAYAKLEQDDRALAQKQLQWETDRADALAAGDQARADKAEQQLQLLAHDKAVLDYNYASLNASTKIAYDKLAFEVGDAEATRQFQAAQASATREFQGGENALDRQLQTFLQQDAHAFQSGENAADRETRLQMQANDLGMAREQLDFAKYQFAAKYGLETAYFNLQKGQLSLQAAAQFAELISSTDPQAVNAFLIAGGGNIMNALAGGGTAVSEEAMLPAAMTLRQARDLEGLQAPALPPYPTSTAAPGNFAAPQAPAVARPAPPSAYAPPPAIGAQGIAPIQAAPQQPQPGQTAAIANPYYLGRGLGSPGLETSLQQTVGEQGAPAGLPAGATVNPASATPLTAAEFQARKAYVNQGAVVAAQGGYSGTVTQPTTFQVGEAGPEQVNVRPLTPTSQAYLTQQKAAYAPEIGEVRALRESTPVNAPVAGGYYNVAFRNVLPTQQELYLRSLQTRYGIPIQDVIAEANRYALSGIRRGGIRVGY